MPAVPAARLGSLTDDILHVVALCQEARALLEHQSQGLLETLAVQVQVSEGE